MKDFYLTPRGDLSVSSINTETNRLEINFVTSKSNALCLNFYIEDVYFDKLSTTSLFVNFNIEKPNYDKQIQLVSGDECMQQAIKIRLNSALGSIRGNVDTGSTLEEYVHELVDNKNIVDSLKMSIANAIKDIIPNPTIIVSQPKSKYVNYSAGFNVLIIDNDRQYSINL